MRMNPLHYGRKKTPLIIGLIAIIILCSPGFFLRTETSETFDYVEVEKIDQGNVILRNVSYINCSNGLPMSGQWPYATRIGDLNNDGHLDIIRLRGHDDFNTPDQGFQIWIGDGTSNWTKIAIPNGNFGYGGTAIGDFNNDGFLDAAYGVHHNRNHPLVGAWAGDGGTSFTESSNGLGTDGETYGMAPIDFGDYNNDGFLDIGIGSFGAGNGLRAYLNNNDGTLWQSQSTGLPYTGNMGDYLFWEDVNRDGFLDIVAGSDQELIWLGDGLGNWTGNDFGLSNNWMRGLDIGDINNDGFLDIVLIEHIEMGNDDWYVPVVYTFNGTGWTNASNGLPTPMTYPEVLFDPVSFGDLNNDGNLDLVGLEGYTTGTWPYYFDWTDIHVWLGDGWGNWTELNEVDTGIPGWPQSLALADIDHTNYLDIIITSSNGDYEPGGLRVYKNTYVPSQLEITLRRPRGGEVFRGGGIRKIMWTSAFLNGTASVSLAYSLTGPQGPWIPIIDNITDTNYYQWTVPTVNTTNGHIKIMLYSGNQTAGAITPESFAIQEGFDTLPPSIQNIIVTPTVQEVNKTLNITCIVSDNNEITDTRIIITPPTGNSINQSMTHSGYIYYWNSSFSLIGNYSFHIWAIDGSGNSCSSGTYNFKIIPLQTRVMYLPLFRGWNLITLSVNTTWTAETLGNNISTCSVITKFEGETQTFITHVIGTPWDDFIIKDGTGYFVYLTENTSLNATGFGVTSISVHLYQEWNIIGWYHTHNTTAESLGKNITDCTLVVLFEAPTQTFSTHVVDTPWNNYMIQEGNGIYIYTTSESWWLGEG